MRGYGNGNDQKDEVRPTRCSFLEKPPPQHYRGDDCRWQSACALMISEAVKHRCVGENKEVDTPEVWTVWGEDLGIVMGPLLELRNGRFNAGPRFIE